MTRSEYIELGKKLHRLAKSGIGGEKINAQKMLDRLMKKYSIRIDEIVLNIIDTYSVTIKKETRFIGVQIVAMVLGLGKCFGRGSNKLIFECDESQFLEIKFLIDVYTRDYTSKLDSFNTAFLYKNDLFPKTDPGDEDDDCSLSRDKIGEIALMFNVITKANYHKAITQ